MEKKGKIKMEWKRVFASDVESIKRSGKENLGH